MKSYLKYQVIQLLWLLFLFWLSFMTWFYLIFLTLFCFSFLPYLEMSTKCLWNVVPFSICHLFLERKKTYHEMTISIIQSMLWVPENDPEKKIFSSFLMNFRILCCNRSAMEEQKRKMCLEACIFCPKAWHFSQGFQHIYKILFVLWCYHKKWLLQLSIMLLPFNKIICIFTCLAHHLWHNLHALQKWTQLPSSLFTHF